MHQDLDAEITKKIRAWWKAFNLIKDEPSPASQEKLDNAIDIRLFNSKVLHFVLICKWDKEDRTSIGYDTKDHEKIHSRNVTMRVHLK